MLRRDDQSIAYPRTKPACGGRSHPTRRLADRETHVVRTFRFASIRTFRRGGPEGPHHGDGIRVEGAIDERTRIDRTKGGMNNRQ